MGIRPRIAYELSNHEHRQWFLFLRKLLRVSLILRENIPIEDIEHAKAFGHLTLILLFRLQIEPDAVRNGGAWRQYRP